MALRAIKSDERPPEGDKQPLAQLVAQELAESGLSQTRAAREIGIASSALSQWLQRKYAGNDAAVAEKLRLWLDARKKRKATAVNMPPAPGYLDTPTGRRILGVLSFAQLAGDIAVIYGAAGLGKTTAAVHYAASNPNAWVVSMSPDCAGVVPALEEVASAIGMHDLPGGAARLRRAIVSRLRGTAGLLIVDEAQHLSIKALECLRAVYDRTWEGESAGAGLVLCGNETVYGRLTGGKRAEHFAQLFSRIGKRLKLTTSAAGDVAAIVDHFAIDDAETRSLLAGIADRPGALRGMVKTLRLASLYASHDAIKPTHVRAAWNDLGEAA